MPSRSFFQKTDLTPHAHRTRTTDKPRKPITSRSAEETAEYIAQMARELAEIAESAQLKMVTYFLKMAQMEAANICSHLSAKNNPTRQTL